ncbi:TIGR01620 family protein [Aliiglaciecola sp. 3_MG-2023]|uniref:YcjF family protein n=1 Tax=Aliiglaciecola sp. 3_MG-2023 TaxID=3062644 RepID=UPI0026E3FD65|nr:TIGR01620 family protein [Aliiglaciecola sp. 3_MG-2023]MDO6695755.1 TIGR01620 family protein [Aliiglaciecola sp. 3_MG-2023]
MNQSKQPMEDSIQSSLILEEAEENSTTELEQEYANEIKPATLLATDIQWQESEPVAERDDDFEAPPSVKSAKSSKLFWVLVLMLGLGCVELALFIREVIVSEDYLSAIWLILFSLIVILAGKELFSQWRGLAHLKRHDEFKQQAQQLINAPTIGQSEGFCEKLIANLPAEEYQTEISQWKNALQAHHVDSEVLQLFEHKVLQKVDEKALGCVTKHASASAAMIAVSPFALLDMIVVLWRNLVMLKQVSQCYGIELGYWGRISLIKRVFKSMLIAGAAEIISDAGNYALGAGVTGKLSSRVAQGLGAGVLTTRIGIKAMHACRPLPWIASKPPGLSKLSQQLLADLKKVTS